MEVLPEGKWSISQLPDKCLHKLSNHLQLQASNRLNALLVNELLLQTVTLIRADYVFLCRSTFFIVQ